MSKKSTGILLVNLGTPERLDSAAIADFLRAFLLDPRVIKLPRWLWQIILRVFILPFRPQKLLGKYQKIWWPEGSPMRVISERQAHALQQYFSENTPDEVSVIFAQMYGEPSMQRAWQAFKEEGITHLVVLPLFPQYSSTTTAAVFDNLARIGLKESYVPTLSFISDYHLNEHYIEGLAGSVERAWLSNGQSEKLLMSFHGIPESYEQAGDPYPTQCRKTSEMLAKRLGLSHGEWALSFQSRFGFAPWVKPYTSETLKQWAKQGIRSVDVICPGFSADCLETLEEVKEENRLLYLKAGGERFHYIEALNDHPTHIAMMAKLVHEHAASA